MNDSGMYWRDARTNFTIAKEGLTKEEAEHILPQLLKKRRYAQSSLALVSLPDKTKIFMFIESGTSAEVPVNEKRQPVKTNKTEEIPVQYQYLVAERRVDY